MKKLTGEERRAHVNAELENREVSALLADGFEDAIIGVAQQFTKDPVVVYDWNKCLEILMQREGLDLEDAIAHMDFNVTGAWVGEQTPMFLVRCEDIVFS